MASRPGFQLFIGNYDPDFAGSPPTTEQFNTELQKQTTEMRNKLTLCKPIAHTYSIAKQVANHNSEQAFSTAGAVVTPARNRLQAWKVESLLLLRHNAMLDGAYCKLAEAKQDMNDATRAVRETLAGRVSAVATTSRGGATSDACRADEHPQREEDSELLALRSRPNVKERHEDSTPETY